MGPLEKIIDEKGELYFLRALVSALLETQKELIKLCGKEIDK